MVRKVAQHLLIRQRKTKKDTNGDLYVLPTIAACLQTSPRAIALQSRRHA